MCGGGDFVCKGVRKGSATWHDMWTRGDGAVKQTQTLMLFLFKNRRSSHRRRHGWRGERVQWMYIYAQVSSAPSLLLPHLERAFLEAGERGLPVGLGDVAVQCLAVIGHLHNNKGVRTCVKKANSGDEENGKRKEKSEREGQRVVCVIGVAGSLVFHFLVCGGRKYEMNMYVPHLNAASCALDAGLFVASYLRVHAELVAIPLGGAEDDYPLVAAGTVHAHDVVDRARPAACS